VRGSESVTLDKGFIVARTRKGSTGRGGDVEISGEQLQVVHGGRS